MRSQCRKVNNGILLGKHEDFGQGDPLLPIIHQADQDDGILQETHVTPSASSPQQRGNGTLHGSETGSIPGKAGAKQSGATDL